MATDICTLVGSRIREERLRRGWSQQFLADRAGCSKVHLIAVEKGRAEIGLRLLQLVADALRLELCELIKAQAQR